MSEMEAGTTRRVPCLTLLYHPDLRRVGERSTLDELYRGGRVELSRLSPLFAHPGCEKGAAIDDPYVSASRPIRIDFQWPHGIEITPTQGARIAIDGAVLKGPRRLTLAEVRQGVVMVLAKRVAVLLHNVDLDLEAAAAGDSMGFVGASDSLARVRRAISRVADLDVPVLIRGESGVGKEHVARAIHERSSRAHQPYLTVNMAAIPRETATSELFGHARGAFTGATGARQGLFERAHRGTLFLDEVGDTPESIQPMLLRVLQNGEIQPLNDRSRTVDVRVVAATDADLDTARESGQFRDALLHRLAGYEIRVPPLRERRDDIPRLVVYFLERELSGTGELCRLEPPRPKQRPWFPLSIMLRLVNHHWTGGNVRQLMNVLRQIVIGNRDADMLRLDDGIATQLSAAAAPPAPRPRVDDAPPRQPTAGPAAADRDPGQGRMRPEDIDEQTLIEALTEHGFAVRPTAKSLGVAPSTLYALIDKSKTLRKAKDIPDRELIACHAELDGDIGAMVMHLKVGKRALRMRLKELGLLS